MLYLGVSMSFSAVKRKIQHSQPFAELKLLLEAGRFPEIVGTTGVGEAVIADFLVREIGRDVILIPSGDAYQHWLDAKSLLEERALFFPAWDIEPYEHRLPDEAIVFTRLDCYLRAQSREPKLIVAEPKALLYPVFPPKTLSEFTIKLKLGDVISPQSLMSRLTAMGYVREDLVEFLGTTSRRGDVLDVFLPSHHDPVRIEFFGDEIESIRLFSAENQRSKVDIQEVSILPPKEWLKPFWAEGDEISSVRALLREDLARKIPGEKIEEIVSRMSVERDFPGSVWFSPLFEPKPVLPLEHFGKDALILCFEPEEVFNEADILLSRAEEHHFELSRGEEFHIPPETLFIGAEAFEEMLTGGDFIAIHQFPTSEDFIDMGFKSMPGSFEGPVAFRRLIEKYREDGVETRIFCENGYQLRNLEQTIPPEEAVPADVAQISESFLHTPSGQALITGSAIFGRKRRTAPKRFYREGTIYALPTGLEEGDFIVHTDHGIGIFKGTDTVTSGGFSSECLVLEYKDGERLYVPVEDFHLVQKYVGGENVQPAKLGGTAWQKAKSRAQRSIMALAGELVQLYALREVAKGTQFPPEDELSAALEDSFPFDETRDQLSALADVIEDMESDKPMDRLLVGDVGFGKTEVAIRAAFKAVRGGKQVAILVPTTVLAEQHYRTFKERLTGLPVDIDLLSRFRSPREQKKTLKRLEAGAVDVIIGTHRLLSKDVIFNDLGLLIIDEEQRFGVKHKEKIKHWRAKVDVLAMSATPIPRTLYLSIAGVRDMSTIDTPPASRLPIYTRAVSFSDETISEAIEKELSRGGQVYFLHNRVGSIEAMAHHLRELVPGARFAVAHGQMAEGELSRIILDFLADKFDVLVTTTIIESGTDIPNVNTILINRADKLGVSQLYQLRGRVGRSDQQAYCYLITPPYRRLTDKAKKRIKAVLEHSDLGSGFALAMRDLEIRGAGNLLGAQQHGFIEEIGLDLYSRMLSEAVSELKGQKPSHFVPVNTQVDTPLFIPKDYIPSTKLRIQFYQRLYMAPIVERLDAIKAEMQDLFGTPPEEVVSLLNYLRMRITASGVAIPLREVVLKKGRATFLFAKNWQPNLAKLDSAISPLKLETDFRRDPFELRFKLAGSADEDMLVMRRIAERLAAIEP
jgi:transcription-repair coupling factor (superfamily II helicase)